jgi:hypothetical protein
MLDIIPTSHIVVNHYNSGIKTRSRTKKQPELQTIIRITLSQEYFAVGAGRTVNNDKGAFASSESVTDYAVGNGKVGRMYLRGRESDGWHNQAVE